MGLLFHVGGDVDAQPHTDRMLAPWIPYGLRDNR